MDAGSMGFIDADSSSFIDAGSISFIDAGSISFIDAGSMIFIKAPGCDAAVRAFSRRFDGVAAVAPPAIRQGASEGLESHRRTAARRLGRQDAR